jgi:hypothetical protein
MVCGENQYWLWSASSGVLAAARQQGLRMSALLRNRHAPHEEGIHLGRRVTRRHATSGQCGRDSGIGHQAWRAAVGAAYGPRQPADSASK